MHASVLSVPAAAAICHDCPPEPQPLTAPAETGSRNSPSQNSQTKPQANRPAFQRTASQTEPTTNQTVIQPSRSADQTRLRHTNRQQPGPPAKPTRQQKIASQTKPPTNPPTKPPAKPNRQPTKPPSSRPKNQPKTRQPPYFRALPSLKALPTLAPRGR